MAPRFEQKNFITKQNVVTTKPTQMRLYVYTYMEVEVERAESGCIFPHLRLPPSPCCPADLRQGRAGSSSSNPGALIPIRQQARGFTHMCVRWHVPHRPLLKTIYLTEPLCVRECVCLSLPACCRCQ